MSYPHGLPLHETNRVLREKGIAAMPKTIQIDATYDSATKRHTAECPVGGCNRSYVRTTKESALWNLSQHVVHQHDLDPVRA